jgi:hypothetical protein
LHRTKGFFLNLLNNYNLSNENKIKLGLKRAIIKHFDAAAVKDKSQTSRIFGEDRQDVQNT